MRSLDFNVTLTSIDPITASIGNAGEHNVTELRFTLSEDILSATDYFRLSVGNFRSEKLYAQDSVVSYFLPQSVLHVGTVLLQLDGFQGEDNEVSLIFKSGLVTAQVGASVISSAEIPIESKEPFENAVNELESLIEIGNTIVEETAENRRVSAESETMANSYKESAEKSAEEASAEATSAKTSAQMAADSKAAAEDSANTAAASAAFAQAQATASAEQRAAVDERAIYVRDVAADTMDNAGYAAEKADSAMDAAAQAEASKESAAASALAAAESADKLKNLVYEDLVMHSTVYENEAPQWQDKSSADYPLISGKEVEFPVKFTQGRTYLCRVWFENDTGKSVTNFYIMPKDGHSDDDCIVAKFISYNSELNCYEIEFVASKTVSRAEDLILIVGYPDKNVVDKDYDAVHGKVVLLLKDTLKNIAGATIDENAVIHATVYENEAPQWQELDDLLSSYSPIGKELNFQMEFTQGKTYFFRVWFENDTGKRDVYFYIAQKKDIYYDPYDRFERLAPYNSELNCYEIEFVAPKTISRAEDLIMFVGYPSINAVDDDLDAVHGKVVLLLKDTLGNVFMTQDEKLYQLEADIETALDNIITIQENLIGGGEA